MPLLTETEALQQDFLPIGSLPQQDEPIDYSFKEKLGAAWRTQNTVGSAMEALKEGIKNPQAQPNYNPMNDLHGYEEYAFSFLHAESAEETNSMKARIDREKQDASMLSGWSGFTAQLINGAIDPINLVPFVGEVSKGLSIGRTAVGTAIAGTLSAGVQETLLHGTQETRTLEESGMNIAGAALIAGVLGGASVLVRDIFHDLGNKTKLEMTPPSMNEPDILAPNSFGLSSAGAAAVRTSDAEVKGALGFEKLIRYASPMMRTAMSPNKETRQILQDLVETPFYYKDNALGVATPIPVETQIKMWNGPRAEAIVELDKSFAEYKKLNGEMKFKEFREEVGKAMRRDDVHQIPQVEQAAKFFRNKIYNPLKDLAIEAKLLPEGVEVSTARSYLTRVYNTEKIIAQRDVFKERITQWLEKESPNNDGDMPLVADDIINHILGVPEGRMGYTPIPMKRGPLKERVFNIPDHMIEDFLHSDIETVTRFYMHTMAPDVELAIKFGDPTMSSYLFKINDKADADISLAATDKARKTIDSQRLADIRDITAMRDRLRGTYGMPNDPNSFFVRAARWTRNENYISMLGSMTLSSVADLGRPVMVHGVISTLKDGLLPLITNYKQYRLAANEAKLAGTALDMVLDSRALELGDIGDTYGRHTKFERGTQYLAEKFGKVALMSPWNASLKQFSSVISQNNFLRAVVNGTDVEKLAMSGIDKNIAEKIASEFKLHGTKGSAWVANTQAWTDHEAINAFRAAIVKDVDRTIVTPGVGDRPLWMSSETGKVIGQFRTFTLASTQRVTLAGLQQRDMAVLNGTLLSIGLGMMMYKIRSDIAGREVSDNPETWVREGIDRSGILGWLYEANNITEKVTNGRIGINRLAGGDTSSRYTNRNISGTLAGPTAGKIDDIARVIGSAAKGEFSESDTRALRRLIPYQNVFYIRSLFDKMEEGVSP